MNFLTPSEQDKLKRFAKSDTFEVVKKVLLKAVYNQGVIEKGKPVNDRNFIYGVYMDATGQVFKKSNEELGTDLRAILEGISHITTGLKEIVEYGRDKPEDKEPKTNEAR